MNPMKDKEKEKKYLKERAKGKSYRKAAIAAGVSKSTATRAERDPRIKSEMARALERVGCTSDKIAQVVHRNLDASKVISANIIKKGKEANDRDGMKDADENTKDFVEVPDGAVQLKATELAGKFRGDFVERKEIEHKGLVRIITNVEDD